MKCTKPFNQLGVEFGCGQCMACRVDRSRLWTSRILIESRLHEHNCFVTLTYDAEHLPKDGSLVRRHLTLFLKRVRKFYPPKSVRYFGVGEYGDESGRPHYHLCLFGVSLLDGSILSQCWIDPKTKKPLGFIKVDELNAGTAGYVSQYVCKKWTNAKDLEVQRALNGRAPEFAAMSLRPGIGAGAAEILAKAIADKDTEIPSRLRMDGTIRPLGRYIRRKLMEHFPDAEEIKTYEKQVWLRSVHEEKLKEMAQAKEAGQTYEKFRWEKRRQKFLNLLSKHKVYKQKRSL